jgi:hypothetical protein
MMYGGQSLVFEPVEEEHEIGILTGEIPGPYHMQEHDTLIVMGSIASATVLKDQVQACIDAMQEAENLDVYIGKVVDKLDKLAP